MPIEARCDVVIVFRAPDGAPLVAVIVEIQHQVDPDKRRTWPLYIAALRSRLGCPVLLLVLAPSATVGRWARQAIPLGHPAFALTPIVVSYEDLPRLTDPSVIPELAVLCARAHPDLEVARTAVDAIRTLPEDQRTLYWNFLMTVLPDLVWQALEAEMTPEQIQNAIAEMSFERGLERGRKQAREEGRAEALRAVAVMLSTNKLGPRFTPIQEARLRSAAPTVLDELIAALIATEDPDELVAILGRIS
jgi:hypothetical protein